MNTYQEGYYHRFISLFLSRSNYFSFGRLMRPGDRLSAVQNLHTVAFLAVLHIFRENHSLNAATSFLSSSLSTSFPSPHPRHVFVPHTTSTYHRLILINSFLSCLTCSLNSLVSLSNTHPRVCVWHKYAKWLFVVDFADTNIDPFLILAIE